MPNRIKHWENFRPCKWALYVESYHTWKRLYEKVSNLEIKQRCKERMEAIQAEFPNHPME